MGRSSKKKRAYNWKSLIIASSRRIWLYSPMRRECLNRAKLTAEVINKDGRVSKRKRLMGYGCERCGKVLSKRDCKVHHTVPVRDMEVWDWNTFIERLFCPPDGLQCLCDGCHKAVHKELKNG